MACDASHLLHHIRVDMNRLWGDADLDPAEFVVEEDINWLDDEGKASEGVSCNYETVKTSNVLISKAAEKLMVGQTTNRPDWPNYLFTNPINWRWRFARNQHFSRCDGISTWVTCHLINWNNWQKMARYQRSWQKRCHCNALVASLMPWPRFHGKQKAVTRANKCSRWPSQDMLFPLIRWSQLNQVS